MYLLDTNLFVEVLLEQEKSDEVERFLDGASAKGLYLTEFSLYSIALLLVKRRMQKDLLKFVDDVLLTDRVSLVRLGPNEIGDIVQVCDRFNLDFDDAYQYRAAEKNNLILVSLDADFDRTERGRKTPAEVLKG